MGPNLQCIVSVALVYFSYFIGPAKGSCGMFSGPEGARDCVLLKDYDSHQWSTCRAAGSLPGYLCVGSYCQYPCMLEKFGKSTGSVCRLCACTPEWCANPDTTKCAWYSACLQVNHSCSARLPVVEYAKQFCNTSFDSFYSSARQWQTDVKECILTKFNGLIRQPDSCTHVKNTAIEELNTCYLQFSVCDLNLRDWAGIFWTVRGLLGTASNPGMDGLIQVTLECPNGVLHEALKFKSDIWNSDSGMRLVRLVLEKLDNKTTGDNLNELPGSIANQLATQLLWKQNGIQWVSFIADARRTNEIAVNIFLGLRSMYDASSPGGSSADMNKTVQDMAEAFGNRKLSLKLSSNVRATRFEACLDTSCIETYYDVMVKLKDATVSSAPAYYASSGLLVSVSYFTFHYPKMART